MEKKHLMISIEPHPSFGATPKMFGLAMEQIKSILEKDASDLHQDSTEGYVDVVVSDKDPDYCHIPSPYRAFYCFLK